jgi:hypothetical protein
MTQRRVALCPFTVTQGQHRGSAVGHRGIVSSPARARMRNVGTAELSRSTCRDITCLVRRGRSAKHVTYFAGPTCEIVACLVQIEPDAGECGCKLRQALPEASSGASPSHLFFNLLLKYSTKGFQPSPPSVPTVARHTTTLRPSFTTVVAFSAFPLTSKPPQPPFRPTTSSKRLAP